MTSTITYLIAPMVNALEMPIMAFPSAEAAHRFCWDLGLRGGQLISDTGDWEPITDRSVPVNRYRYALQGGEHVPLSEALRVEGERLWQAVPALFGPDRVPVAPITAALFRDAHYDDGNNELYSIEIRTHSVGDPVVYWDFD